MSMAADPPFCAGCQDVNTRALHTCGRGMQPPLPPPPTPYYTIQRCPVCEGRGNVPGGFYTRGGFAERTGPDLCSTCGGSGILRVSTLGTVEKVRP